MFPPVASGVTFRNLHVLVCIAIGGQSCTAGWVCVQSGAVQEHGMSPPANIDPVSQPKIFLILCCLNLCLTIVYNKWIKRLFPSRLLFSFPRSLYTRCSINAGWISFRFTAEGSLTCCFASRSIWRPRTPPAPWASHQHTLLILRRKDVIQATGAGIHPPPAPPGR